jgi:hypothetical protein
MIRYRLQRKQVKRPSNGKNGKKIRLAIKGMCCLQSAIRMAQEMGKRLGKCPLLLRPMSKSALVQENGAGYKVRTRDPLITNQVLYQLS